MSDYISLVKPVVLGLAAIVDQFRQSAYCSNDASDDEVREIASKAFLFSKALKDVMDDLTPAQKSHLLVGLLILLRSLGYRTNDNKSIATSFAGLFSNCIEDCIQQTAKDAKRPGMGSVEFFMTLILNKPEFE